MLLLPLTNSGTDGDGGEYAPSLLTIMKAGGDKVSMGPFATGGGQLFLLKE